MSKTAKQDTAPKMLTLSKTLALKTDGLQENRMAGDASGLGNMDSYTDVIFPDGFSQEVIDDFLSSGFIADCHDWSKVIGFPLVAERRGNVMYTECEFHSTPDAQNVRTKCAERIAANKLVGLSVGIGFYAEDTKTFANGAALLKFAEEQGQDMSLFDVEGIKAHTGKCRAIIKIAKWYEYSPITTATPANPKAWASSVKSGITGADQFELDEPEIAEIAIRGQYLGESVLGSMTMSAIYRASDALMYNVFWDAVYNDEIPLDERRATIVGGVKEYAGLVLRVFDAIMAEDPEEGTETAEDALKSIKALWSDPKLSQEELPAGSFERQLKSTLAVVVGCTERTQSLIELRKKDGRTLSSARREGLAQHEEQLTSLLTTLKTLQQDAEVVTDVVPTTEDIPAPELDDAAKSRLAAIRVKQIQRKNRDRPTFDAPGGE